MTFESLFPQTKLQCFLTFCPQGHSSDHQPTLHGQLWTLDLPPTHLILSTWYMNDPYGHFKNLMQNPAGLKKATKIFF